MSKEIKVALLAVVSGFLLFFGYKFLKGSSIFSGEKDYYVMYDSVDGLIASNPVMLNGVSVGRVKATEILTDRGNKVLVTLTLGKKIVVTDRSTAVLADGGLLGGKLIYLKIAPGRELERKDTLLGTAEVGLTTLLQGKAMPVMENADSLVRNLNIVVSRFKQTGNVLNQLLANVDQTGLVLRGTLQDNRLALKTTLDNANRLTASLVETERQLKPMLGKLNQMGDSLAALQLGQTLNRANQTIADLNTTIKGFQPLVNDLNAGKGTAGRLLKSEELYNQMNLLLRDIDKLMVDIRQQPKRYVHFSVFGGKKGKTPGDTLGDGTR